MPPANVYPSWGWYTTHIAALGDLHRRKRPLHQFTNRPPNASAHGNGGGEQSGHNRKRQRQCTHREDLYTYPRSNQHRETVRRRSTLQKSAIYASHLNPNRIFCCELCIRPNCNVQSSEILGISDKEHECTARVVTSFNRHSCKEEFMNKTSLTKLHEQRLCD